MDIEGRKLTRSDGVPLIVALYDRDIGITIIHAETKKEEYCLNKSQVVNSCLWFDHPEEAVEEFYYAISSVFEQQILTSHMSDILITPENLRFTILESGGDARARNVTSSVCAFK